MSRRASLLAAIVLTLLAGAALAPRVVKISGAQAATPVVAVSVASPAG